MTLRRAVPGLMALYPLCDHGQRPREAIRHAAEVIERTAPGPELVADNLFLLSLFGGLAYPRLDASAIIGSEKMNESRIVRELRAATRRQDLLDIVEERFGGAARTELTEGIEAIADPDLLRRLLRLAAACSRLEEFRAALAAPTPAR